MTGDELRRAYQRRMRTEPGDDVSLDELRALVEQSGDEATRLEILDRVMRSERSRAEFELLRSAATAGRNAAPRRGARRWPWLAAVAAALVAVLWGAVSLSRRTDEPVMRGAPERVTLLQPADGAELLYGRTVRLSWSRQATTAHYFVEVIGAGGMAAWSGDTRDTTIVPNVILQPGTWRWRVEALTQAGRRLPSELREFHVSAGPTTAPRE